MAELSDFLPKTGPFYTSDIFSGTSPTITDTTVTAVASNVANITGSGLVSVDGNNNDQITLILDGTTLSGSISELTMLTGGGNSAGPFTFKTSLVLNVTSVVTNPISGLANVRVTVAT